VFRDLFTAGIFSVGINLSTEWRPPTMVRKVLTYVGVFAAGVLAVVGYLMLGGPGVNAPSAQPEISPTSASSAAAGDGALTPIGDVVRNSVVTVAGTVQRISDEDEFILADESGSISVWTGSQFFTVDQGESVVVTGFIDDDLIIEIYAQEITRADGTVVTIGGSSASDSSSTPAAPQNPSTPASAEAPAVTPIGDVVKNSMVTVSGTVQRITDEDEFVVADSTGSITVWTGSQFFTVDQGESVVVTGFIDDDLIIEIYAQEITRADGTVVTIGGSSER
jgi:uncharacterized protein YdeI (BOF family)